MINTASLSAGPPAVIAAQNDCEQNQPADSFIAADEAEKGMAAMAEVFDETGRELYLGAGGREHD